MRGANSSHIFCPEAATTFAYQAQLSRF